MNASDPAAVGTPDVSVVIPAHNAMPYIVQTLESVLAQTLGTDRIEVIVVDDGSRDGTGEELDRWATAHPALLRVVHQPASGGPAGPRNTGLDLVSGRYVFFLDADDHLGPEALQRLVETADEHGSDIVLGKQVAEGDRVGVPQSMFRRNDLDADLFTSRIYWTLTSLRLFRRSLLEEHGIRFPTDLPIGSDQPFTALAYLRAGRISVLSDYDFYFLRLRDDGKHVTQHGSTPDRLRSVEAMCALLEREVADPSQRAVLLTRHFQIDLLTVMRRLHASPDDVRAGLFDRIGALVRSQLSTEVAERLSVEARLIYHLAGRGLLEETLAVAAHTADGPVAATIEGGQVLAHLPFFRDPVLEVPDRIYDLTDRVRLRQSLASYSLQGEELQVAGSARFTHIVSLPDDEAEVVLRRTGKNHREYAVPAARATDDAISARVDLATVADGQALPPGSWDVAIRMRRGGFATTQRLTVPATGQSAQPPPPPAPSDAAAARVTAAGIFQVVVPRPTAPAAPASPGWAYRVARRLRRR